MASDAVAAIKASVPPETDYLTYLTVVESHLCPEILPSLNEILQDAGLTQNIGWDLIQLLLPLPGAEACLNTIARLGNPREVVLKVTEALRLLDLDDEASEGEDGKAEISEEVPGDELRVAGNPSEPKDIDKYCILLSLLSILHPRIKTKYPSRFLSTSLMAAISSYRPSSQATSAVISFIHALSGTERPPFPQRASSKIILLNVDVEAVPPAPDPEATAEEPQEEAIQKKLLQSFVTHILEIYVNANGLEWSARLQEHYHPNMVIPEKSLGEAFKQNFVLQERDRTVGQLVALARDLGLINLETLFAAIYLEESPEALQADTLLSSPDDIPLSRVGSLFLVAYFVFSSILFNTNLPLPPLSIFPGHAKLVKQFIGTYGPATSGTEEEGVLDTIIAIGLWLENSNKFVSGPLGDEDFLQHLQTLSLLSANSPSPTIRYTAHTLTSSILHAHPIDRTRLTFIIDTLENCPYENLKASAVVWLKNEIITAKDRNAEDVFSSEVALLSARPFLFPDMSPLATASDLEAWEEIRQGFAFHMAVLSFLYFLSGGGYPRVHESGTLSIAAEIYVQPLSAVQKRLETSLSSGGEMYKTMEEAEVGVALSEIQLLGYRLAVCV